MTKRFINYFNLVKFPHTIFALPFAILAFVLANNSFSNQLDLLLFLKILAAMVFARNSAMGFNRYVDRFIDAKNPRTANREIPSGLIDQKRALFFIILNILLFIAVTYTINQICFILSVPALVLLLGYSYTKRFTWLCHFVLGLTLASAPVGAYLAVSSHIGFEIVLLFFVVLFWVAGFDIIYSLSDSEFDRDNNLHSVPQKFGIKVGLLISLISHLIVIPLLIYFGIVAYMGVIYYFGALIFTVLLIYQHTIVKHDNISRVNAAFFSVNGYASVLFSLLAILDVILK